VESYPQPTKRFSQSEPKRLTVAADIAAFIELQGNNKYFSRTLNGLLSDPMDGVCSNALHLFYSSVATPEK